MNTCWIASAAIALAMSTSAVAQVTSDGTLGTNVSQTGQTYTISGGTILNNENQFHSFDQFDLATLNIADFTGAASIQNIVSRITGGQQSSINGTIRSSINGANLWIINPDGVVFGATSSLGVTGSFHVSSADYLLLEGGGQFFADPSANSVLTIGNPSTFGFLQEPTGNIVTTGADLSVPDGETISLIGHEVWLQDFSKLTAVGGRVNLVSVGSAGEVTPLADGIDNTGISYNDDGERVLITGRSTLDVSGDGGGSVYIRGGRFTMGGDEQDDESIYADTLGGTDGGIIDIDVAGDVTLQGVMTANTFGSGAGGDIRVSGRNIFTPDRQGGIAGQAAIETRANSSGNAGSITLNADSIYLDAPLRVSTSGSGNAGNIRITANDLSLNVQDAITSSTSGEGAGGDIDIALLGALFIQAGDIRAETSGNVNGGAAGNISITADNFSNTGAFSISTTTLGDGTGGNIMLDAATSMDFDNGDISSSATSAGDGGSITLRALSGTIALRESIDGDAVTIQSNTTGSGNAGRINIEGDTVTIFEQASVAATTVATGNAGNISISATNLFDLDGPATIVSSSSGPNSGPAGTVAILAGEVSIENGASISVSTESNNVDNVAGQIDITATQSVTINNGDLSNPVLSATTTGGSSGGSISIAAPIVNIEDSLMRSSTNSAGDAGNISITGDVSLDLFSSIFEAGTSGTGLGGDIILSGGDIVLDGFTDLLANTSGMAQAGSIQIGGDNVQILAAFIEAAAGLNGTGGSIDFNASNQLRIADHAAVRATTEGAGDGGNVTLNAASLRITGNANILVSTTGSGNGGIVMLSGTDVLVDGQAKISGDTTDIGTGGTIDVTADSLLVHETGSISADTSGPGTGGNVVINAVDMVVSGGGIVSASTSGPGTGGDVSISGGLLTVTDGGRIEATANGDGTGGSIRIAPDHFRLDPNGLVTVNASGNGDAGAIDIDVNETVYMTNARIESTSEQSNGGDISISAGDLIFITDSDIFASGAPVESGSPGDAGDIRLGTDTNPAAPAFLIFQGAYVAADAGGSGGAINVHAQYTLGSDYVFDAHSATGNDGEITIDVPATDFVSIISQLDLPILNVAELLDDQCVVFALSERSSFVIDSVRLPPSPEAYKSSGYYLPDNLSTTSLPPVTDTYVANVFLPGGC